MYIIHILAKALVSYVVRVNVNNPQRRSMIDVRFILGTLKLYISIKDLRDISIKVIHMTFNHYYASSNLVYPK